MLVVIKRRRLLWSALVLLLCVAELATMLLFPGQFSATTQALLRLDRRLPIYSVQTAEKKIAISFDAAWGADQTEELLSILEEHQVKTTFFLVRFWVEKYPEMVQRIAAAGHEIGSHSATHPHMASLSREQIQQELTSTGELIKTVSGQTPTLFRPPFGEYNNDVIEVAEALGYRTIQWSVDSLDWQTLSTAEIVQRVETRIKPGSIVLFHNNGEHTADAIRQVLDFCDQEGYQVVPISALLLPGEYYVDVNGQMCPK